MVQNVLSASDFDNILDDYAGQQIELNRISKVVTNVYGEEVLTDGKSENIKAYFMRTGLGWDYEKMGFLERGDSVALTKIADAVKKDDKIIVGGKSYRVKEAFDVPGVFDSTYPASTLWTILYLYLNNWCNKTSVRMAEGVEKHGWVVLISISALILVEK